METMNYVKGQKVVVEVTHWDQTREEVKTVLKVNPKTVLIGTPGFENIAKLYRKSDGHTVNLSTTIRRIARAL